MSKEVIITKEVLEFEEKELDKAIDRFKGLAVATGALATAKAGVAVAPTVIRFLKGSIVFLDLAIPNYFTIILGAAALASSLDKYFETRDKIKQEAIKNGKVGKLLTLDEGDIKKEIKRQVRAEYSKNRAEQNCNCGEDCND